MAKPDDAGENRQRALIVVFDALRPDMVTAERMPVLSRFAAGGTRFTAARAAFPTETRVNQASLITGAKPDDHGIVGNRFMDADAAPGRLINSADEDQLAAAQKALGGALIDVPTLGEVLAATGRSLAIIGSGTAGGTRLLHHRAADVGGFRFSLDRPDASTPAERIAEVMRLLGPMPPETPPSTGRCSYAVDTYLAYVEPRLRPDVTIVWFSEPDFSFHFTGIGSPESLEAMRHVDERFGRILARWAAQPDEARPLMVTMSDHGHLDTIGEPLDLVGRLCEAGFRAGDAFAADVDMVAYASDAGGIYVRDSHAATIDAVAGWLRAQPWCGPVFQGKGAMGLDRLAVGHRRGPDIAFITRADDGAGPHGWPGRCPYDSPKKRLRGVHGGLHPAETATWLAMQGNGVRRGYVSPLPAGVIDVLPTVLHILGVDIPGTVEGRLLAEGLEEYADRPLPTVENDTVAITDGAGRRTHLTVSRVAGREYLDNCRVEDTDGTLPPGPATPN